MSGPLVTEIDLAPFQLLRWLEAEFDRAGEHGFRLRATREWRVETVSPGTEDLDPEDGLAAHTAYGTLEMIGTDESWRLVMEIADDLGGATASDWPPIDEEPDGAQEVSLETFAETFEIDGLEGAVTLETGDAGARRKAERLIARILADTHRG
jgi:hypothetical protein